MGHAVHAPSTSKIWLDCGEYYAHYVKATAEGEEFNSWSAAADRGTVLHSVIELALKDWVESKGVLELRAYVETAWSIVLDQKDSDEIETAKSLIDEEEDLGQVELALHMAVDLIHSGPDPQVMIETQVPLSHEPGAIGTVDLAVIFSDGEIVVADHKFGQIAVPADGPQNKIYASNLVRELWDQVKIKPNAVRLAIIQPAIRKEPFVRRVNLTSLSSFMGFVEHTVDRQLGGHDTRGAESLEVCDNFCPFKLRCGTHQKLIASQLGILDNEPITEEQIETLVENRTRLKAHIDELSGLVAGDEKRFPGWNRISVDNPRKWVGEEICTVADIAHNLRLKGVDDPYVLATPAALKKKYPEVSDLIGSYSTDSGHHVRLGKRKAEDEIIDKVLTTTSKTRDLFNLKKKEKKKTPNKKTAKKRTAKKKATKKKAGKKK